MLIINNHCKHFKQRELIELPLVTPEDFSSNVAISNFCVHLVTVSYLEKTENKIIGRLWLLRTLL